MYYHLVNTLYIYNYIEIYRRLGVFIVDLAIELWYNLNNEIGFLLNSIYFMKTVIIRYKEFIRI